MTLRELIDSLMKELGDENIEEFVSQNDIEIEVYNKRSACLVTIKVEQLEPSAPKMH